LARAGPSRSAVDGDPGLDDFEVLEEDGAVDGEIADDGELGERGETDGLIGSFFLQRVDEVEQAMRARPLISMAQEPQISSRQLES